MEQRQEVRVTDTGEGEMSRSGAGRSGQDAGALFFLSERESGFQERVYPLWKAMSSYPEKRVIRRRST